MKKLICCVLIGVGLILAGCASAPTRFEHKTDPFVFHSDPGFFFGHHR